MDTFKDASHLYDVERRTYYAERPGFRIGELKISPTQKVPWHFHNNIQDTFYVIEGRLILFLREPVIATGEQFHLLHGNELDDMAQASPALVGERLLIRTEHWLYSIRQRRS